METWKSSIKLYCAPIVFATALFSGSALLLMLINFYVPQPYMDEIFHVDQMRRYCAGRFNEWNDKITTPPALYLASYGIWYVSDRLSKTASIFENSLIFNCNSVASLRFLNLAFLTALYFIVSDILKLTMNSERSSRYADGSGSIAIGNRNFIVRYATALNLCLFPVLYFSAFLYYTDVLSTLMVMAMYLFYLRRWRSISAIFGAGACGVRQTNIIWVAFCCYLTAVDAVAEHFGEMDRKRHKDRQKRDDGGVKAIRQIDYANDNIAMISRLKKLVALSQWTELTLIAVRCLQWALNYVLVGIGFVAFVIWNGGVALGDRSAHQACPHLVQFFYCILFICIFGFAVVTTKPTIACVYRLFIRRPAFAIMATGMAMAAIYGYTYDHPYLLADNRHYTFYIWRRWFMRHVALKYLLAPAYICAFIAVTRSLGSRSVLWRLGFFGAVFLVTVPNRLLEFRYFILPFFFWRLHVPALSKVRLALEFLFFMAINAATFALFVLKPFKWPNSDDWQRFMW